eukprot:6213414-Pleurochrysis_carterae.AAC.2
MAGGKEICSPGQGILQKQLELNMPIAVHVRIWGAAHRQAFNEGMEDVLPVFSDKIHFLETYAKTTTDLLRIIELALATFSIALVIGVPVGHVDARNVMALLFQKQSCY